jgi:hypothetical protein
MVEGVFENHFLVFSTIGMFHVEHSYSYSCIKHCVFSRGTPII